MACILISHSIVDFVARENLPVYQCIHDGIHSSRLTHTYTQRKSCCLLLLLDTKNRTSRSPKIASRTKVAAFQQDCLLESSEIEYRYIFWYEQGVRPNRVGTTMITLLAFCTGYYGFIGYKPTQHNHIHGVYK